MRRRAGLREKWVSEVLTSNVTDACKVVLFAMSTRMSDSGYVSIPRVELAEMVDRHPARISERIAEAKAAGLLGQVGGGHRGRTAEYVAQLINGYGQPVSISGNHSEAQQAGMVTGQPVSQTRARTTEVPPSVSEGGAVHDPGGSHDDDTDDSDARGFVNRYGQLHSTRQAGMHLARVVGEPPAHGSAPRHDLTARLRLAGLSPRRQVFAWTTTGLAA